MDGNAYIEVEMDATTTVGTNNGTDTSDSSGSSGLGTTEIALIIAGIIFVWFIMVICAIYCWCKTKGKPKKKNKGTKKENSDQEKIIGKPKKSQGKSRFHL